MTITIPTNQVLKVLEVLAWIIFIGLCIDAGSFLFHAFHTFVIKPDDVAYEWKQADLSALYNYDKGHFLVMCFYMATAAIMRAVMFYMIVDVFYHKKLTLSNPFNKKTYRFVVSMAWITLFIGLFSHGGVEYSEWLAGKGLAMPGIDKMRLGGADVWLFMSVTLFVISQIFKKGIELQTENDLTV